MTPEEKAYYDRELYYPAPEGGLGAVNCSENAVRLVVGEVLRATKKFPTWPTDPLHALGIVHEELGELNCEMGRLDKEVLQLCYEPHKSSREAVMAEAIQTAAMALRFLMSLDAYEFQRQAQHSQISGLTSERRVVE